MKYMLLVYAPEDAWTEKERQDCYVESTELTHELQALTRPGAQWAPDPQQPLSCVSADGWRRHVADVAQLGELGALRARHTGR